MKKPLPLQLLLVVLLGFAAAVYAGRAACWRFPQKHDFSRRQIHHLRPETEAFLDSLKEPVFLTYVATGRDRMPSNLKRVERGVVETLKALKARAPEFVDFEVLDPSLDPNMENVVAQKKVSPFHVGDIEGDEKTEQTVWSSLIISRGPYRDVILHAVEEAHINYIEPLIVGHLKNMADPIKPAVGLAAPKDGYKELEGQLAQQGKVVRVDFEETAALPAEIDALYWMEPKSVSAAHVRELKRFLASGRNAVVADTLYGVEARPGASPGEIEFEARPKETEINEVLRPFGLELEKKILFDERSETITAADGAGGTKEVKLPYLIATTPKTHDMKMFAGPSKGALRFANASAIAKDDRTLGELGFEATSAVTTSENAWTMPLSPMRLTEADLTATVYQSKQPMVVLLSHSEPFYGRMLVVGSTAIFDDEGMTRPGFAHRPFLQLLGRTFLSPEVLVKMRVDRLLPPPVPEMTASAVLFWRMAILGLVPLGFLLPAFFRFRDAAPASSKARAKVFKPVAGGFALIVAACIVNSAAGSLTQGAQADFTEEKIHSVSDFTARSLRSLDAPVEAKLYITQKAGMPAAMKTVQQRVESLMTQFERASGKKIRFSIINPEALPDGERNALLEKGVKPVLREVMEFDSVVRREVWSALTFVRGGRTAVAPSLTDENIQKLEFYVMMALEDLKRGRPARIVIASDLPRLSPAEAYEDFQKKQLIAPIAADVYSEAKEGLEQNGFETINIDQREPKLPENPNLLIWLQPRRPHDEMTELFGRHLASGGKAIVAVQHFNIQQRQYSGRSFKTVYWPQPQYSDLNDYLDLLGAPLAREVLMDESQSRLALETQINRLAVREHEKQAVARPFLIRTVGASFAPDSPVVSSLGDLLFIWGNRFLLDEKKLAENGLTAKTLISTTDRAWSYDWNGGFLGDEVFNDRNYLPGQQPLAVMLEGTFPPVRLFQPAQTAPEFQVDPEKLESGVPPSIAPQEMKTPAAQEEAAPVAAVEPEIRIDSESAPSGRPGALLLIGDSEMFKTAHLHEPDFQHERLLLNAAAYMALGPEMAALQSREIAARGFEPPPAKTAIRLRAFVFGFTPGLSALFGLVWLVSQKRRSPYDRRARQS